MELICFYKIIHPHPFTQQDQEGLQQRWWPQVDQMAIRTYSLFINTLWWQLYINGVSVGSLLEQPLPEVGSLIKKLPEVWTFNSEITFLYSLSPNFFMEILALMKRHILGTRIILLGYASLLLTVFKYISMSWNPYFVAQCPIWCMLYRWEYLQGICVKSGTPSLSPP